MTTPATGLNVHALDMFRMNAFTPAWVNVTPGGGAENQGWYQQIGSFVLWGFRLEFGTSPAISGIAELTLPVVAYDGGGTGLQACLGEWNLRDASGTVKHHGGSIGVFGSGGTLASFAGAWDATAPQLRVTTNIPFAIALNDVLSGTGCYRAA